MSITVIGNGAWGQALARLAVLSGEQVRLWGRKRKNLEGLHETEDLSEACLSQEDSRGHFIMALPCHALPQICADMSQFIAAESLFISATKGMTPVGDGFRLASEIIAASFTKPQIAVLAGPNFAGEVAQGFPAASAIAGDEAACEFAMRVLAHKHFRLYRHGSMQAVELCAVMKNIIAIACGISVGLGLGENAKAALITRGLDEMRRLVVKICGDSQDVSDIIMGLAGIGDLSLTCSSLQSRNMAFGYALGQGKNAKQALGEAKGVCEGVAAAVAIASLAQKRRIELPIIFAVKAILHENKPLAEALADLLNRPNL